MAKALGDDLSGDDTAMACEHEYRTTIASKAALIVVDDVWSKSDIEQLLVESPRSRFLFTTRDAAIGRFVRRVSIVLTCWMLRNRVSCWRRGRTPLLPYS